MNAVGVTAKLRRVIDHIDAHLKDDISIAALADIAGYSPWHLYHVFMDCTGTPVMEYVRLRRLHSAVDELAHGRKLYDIALDYGFETQAGFCKAFQRHFGCSPTRYRIHKLRGINFQIAPVLLDVAKRGGNMQDRVTIRVVQETDAEDLWENIFSQNTLAEVKRRVTSLYLKAYAAGVGVPLVAEVDGHVVGNIYMTFIEHPLRAHICELGDIVVNPGFQRMGIARRLLEECKTLAVNVGKTKSVASVRGATTDECRTLAANTGKSMMLTSARGGTTAETVYRKLGFIEYGRLPNSLIEGPPFWENQCAYDEVLFYMPLTPSE